MLLSVLFVFLRALQESSYKDVEFYLTYIFQVLWGDKLENYPNNQRKVKQNKEKVRRLNMKKFTFIVICLATLMFANSVYAEFKVPIVENKDEWKVQLLEYSSERGLAQPIKGENELYTLKVENTGSKPAYNTHIRVFNQEKDSDKFIGLAPQMFGKKMNQGESFVFQNFPIKTGITNLEILIIWEEEPITMTDGHKANGRTFMEKITITKGK